MSNVKVKRSCTNIERSYIYHKEYSCEISKLCETHCLKVSSKVKVSDRFTE